MKCNDLIRAFIAVEISEQIKDRIVSLQDRLRTSAINVSWVRPLNIHLTIIFLGDISREITDRVAANMDLVARGVVSFTLEVMGVGYFGRPRHPKVIWVGLNDAAGVLVELHEKLSRVVGDFHESYDTKHFVPHLTIGRVRAPGSTSELLRQIETGCDEQFGQMLVRSIVLFRSELHSEGPVHTVLHRSAFRSGSQDV